MLIVLAPCITGVAQHVDHLPPIARGHRACLSLIYISMVNTLSIDNITIICIFMLSII